ncbi:myb-like DNA-binding domain-containing protein [Colletotrichum orchidophilum]|uniref:Myb-like DNA-binding domain-containing protein n=1 Tax=Colletotrichum orchidophilum TaxID=1209926 RepID=A0A1G4AXI6_9PEZI|nr:myb-like DNA-binding domain-containing protein [Colletotrichum orchidophilum]OHE93762.1 myb-like DNA-binding domain-containing protein [Colletotrichum orchidophilum]
MSSMFKKKAGMAFKPKMPTARPRAPGAAAPQPARAPSTTAAAIATPAESSNESADTTASSTAEKRADTRDTPGNGSTSTPPSTEPRTAQAATPQTQSTTNEPSAKPAPALEAAGKSKVTETPATSTHSRPQPPSATPAPTRDRASVVNEASTPAQLQTPPAPVPSAIDVVPSTESAGLPAASTDDTAKTATKKAPPKRPRKRATQTSEATEEGEDGAPVPKPKRQRKQPTDGEAAPKRPPRPRKKKATEEGETDAAAATNKPVRPRQARSVTPEDAEEQEADLTTLTMGDLTRDLRIGKKFSRHDELLQRHRDKQAKSRERLKAKRNGSEDVASESGTPAPTSGQATPAAPPPPKPASMASTGPQFQIIDGQIVVDQTSLSLDRHAIAAAAAEGEDMLEIEENDFTTLTTQNSYRTGSKLKGPNVWNEEETELFYRGLRMFGTDFQMISGMFPGKNRRHVKMKFNREERHAPARIDAILVGKKELQIDLEEYKTWTKAEYEPVEAIMAAQRAQQAEFDAEQAKIKAAKDAINARNLASLQDKREGGADAGVESSTTGGGGSGGAKPKRQQASVGPQITVDADGMITIDETNMDPDAGRKKRGAGKTKKKAVEYNMRGEIIH